jgi:hypothetical protein
MGGGLTRGLGLLFSQLTIASWFFLREKNNSSSFFLIALILSLSALTHPEAAIFAFLSLFLAVIFSQKKTQELIRFCVVSLLTVVITSPWWMTLLMRYGTGPFLEARLTGGNFQAVANYIFSFSFLEQSMLDILGVFCFLGFFYHLSQKKFYYPVWVLALIIINSRSASRFTVVPLSILATSLLFDIIFPFVKNIYKQSINKTLRSFSLLFIVFYISLSSLIAPFSSDWRIPVVLKKHREAMEWIKNNTDKNSKFLVIPAEHNGNWAKESVMEWFPVLAQRQSLATVQGSEWLKGEAILRLYEYFSLLECRTASAACLRLWTVDYQKTYTHVYISKESNLVKGYPRCCDSLLASLRQEMEYMVIFENESVVIFQYTQSSSKLGSENFHNLLD